MAQNGTNHSATSAGCDRHTHTVGAGVLAPSLDRITATAPDVEGIRAADLLAGDWIVVRTRNSVYSLAVQGDGSYEVAGGWFAAAGAEPTCVRVAGCTWGGSAILTGMVAAPGMFLEFSNGVRTTRIRDAHLVRQADAARAH